MANGIPSLLGQVVNVVNTAALLVADAEIILGLFAGPKWGVFNPDGSIALQPDSMISLDFRRDWKIPNYPVEQGAFQSYNKVGLPSDTRIRLSKGGTDSERHAFLVQVAAAAKSLNLYNIVMPEGALIQSVNFTSYAISRTSTNGVGLISIDLQLEEVRVTATAAFSNNNTAAPSGADPVNDGQVQATAVPTPQISVSALQ
jgi:hypothetical protein